MISEKHEADELRRKSALIRFYFKEDTENMSYEEFGRAWGQLEFSLKFTNPNGK